MQWRETQRGCESPEDEGPDLERSVKTCCGEWEVELNHERLSKDEEKHYTCRKELVPNEAWKQERAFCLGT